MQDVLSNEDDAFDDTVKDMRDHILASVTSRREALLEEIESVQTQIGKSDGGRHVPILRRKLSILNQRLLAEGDVEGELAAFDEKVERYAAMCEAERKKEEEKKKMRGDGEANETWHVRRRDKCIMWGDAVQDGKLFSDVDKRGVKDSIVREMVTRMPSLRDREASRKRARDEDVDLNAEECSRCRKCGTRLFVSDAEAKKICPMCCSTSTIMNNVSTVVNYGDSRLYNASDYLSTEYVSKRLIAIQVKDRTALKPEAVRAVGHWCMSRGLWDKRILRRPEVLLTAMKDMGMSDDYHRLSHFALALTGMHPPRIDSWMEKQVLGCFMAVKRIADREFAGTQMNSYYYMYHIFRLLGIDHMTEYLQFLPNESKIERADAERCQIERMLGWPHRPTNLHETIMPKLHIFRHCVLQDNYERYFLYLRDVEEMPFPGIVHPSCDGMPGEVMCRHCQSTTHATSAHGLYGRKDIALPDGPISVAPSTIRVALSEVA